MLNVYLYMEKKKKKMGRPERYGEATKILAIRVPISKYSHYLEIFKKVLNKDY